VSVFEQLTTVVGRADDCTISVRNVFGKVSALAWVPVIWQKQLVIVWQAGASDMAEAVGHCVAGRCQ
jgi:hypothetical protein